MEAFLRPDVAAAALVIRIGSLLRFSADANKGPGAPQARPVPFALHSVIGLMPHRLDAGASSESSRCRTNIVGLIRPQVERGLFSGINEPALLSMKGCRELMRLAVLVIEDVLHGLAAGEQRVG